MNDDVMKVIDRALQVAYTVGFSEGIKELKSKVFKDGKQ